MQCTCCRSTVALGGTDWKVAEAGTVAGSTKFIAPNIGGAIANLDQGNTVPKSSKAMCFITNIKPSFGNHYAHISCAKCKNANVKISTAKPASCKVVCSDPFKKGCPHDPAVGVYTIKSTLMCRYRTPGSNASSSFEARLASDALIRFSGVGSVDAMQRMEADSKKEDIEALTSK